MLDRDAWREKRAPVKEKFRNDPNSALLTLKSSGTLDDTNITCKLETGKALKEAKERVAGLHPLAGGEPFEVSGELCSGDLLLESLVACAGVTLKACATSLQIPIKKGRVTAEGDLDFKGTNGIDKNAPVGFTDIRLGFELELEDGAEVTDEAIEKLGQYTEKYCVVLQTIAHKPNIRVNLWGNQASEDGVDKGYAWGQKM